MKVNADYGQIERLHKLIGRAVVVARIVKVFSGNFTLLTLAVLQTYVRDFPTDS